MLFVSTTAAATRRHLQSKLKPRNATLFQPHRKLNTYPWLSDKSLYPLLAVTIATVGFGVWFGPWWLYKTPDVKVNPKRRQTGPIADSLKEYEETPVLGKELYEKSQELTPVIYKATIKGELADEEPSKIPDNATAAATQG